MTTPQIDWEPLRKYGPHEVECKCGMVYRSLTKSVIHEGRFTTVSETPCPGCRKYMNHARHISYDPERMPLGGSE